jgi:ATP-dependent Clp protease ATP-binding subunit ClpA
MTSNLGAAESERNSIGFASLAKQGEDDRAVKEFFKPEFRNRLDGIVKFNKLAKETVRKIVVKFVQDMNDLLSDKRIFVDLSTSAIDHVIELGYDDKMGARPLARKINELVKVPLSKKILFENLQNCTVNVEYYNNELQFNITENTYLVYPTESTIDENGYIILDKIKSNC